MTMMQFGRRRCDARCYTARHEKCSCICDGENHGAHVQGAVANMLEKGEKLRQAAERKATGQLSLFQAE